MQRLTASDNPTSVGSLTVYLGSSSVGGEFRDDTNPANVITPVVIPDGSSTATFRYSDTAAGTPTITAADQVGPDSGLTDATQLETVTPAAASQLRACRRRPPRSQVRPFDVTVTALDEFGNTDTNYAGTVTFSSTGSGTHAAGGHDADERDRHLPGDPHPGRQARRSRPTTCRQLDRRHFGTRSR